jgi:acyl-CoA reductase-like NAD-dependent aldehyde dehydrogenase
MADFNFKTFTNTINGEQRSTETTRRAINPATTDELAPVPVSTEKDLDEAVKAARSAFKSWKLTTIEDRKERLLKFADAINAHKDEFAAQLTQEQGKPVRRHARKFVDASKLMGHT